MKNILGAITIISALFGFSPVQASPISFIETADFGNTNTSGMYLGTFDVGLNIVSGNILALAGADRLASDYGDFWDADLAPGQQITGIDILLSNTTGGMRGFAGDNIIGCCTSDTYTALAFTQQSTDGTHALTTTDPFGGIFSSGSYPFAAGHYYFGTLVPGVNASEFSYEWQITVTNTLVPVPAAVWLFGTALVGLIGVSRQKRET